jgi:hypothetical protein
MILDLYQVLTYHKYMCEIIDLFSIFLWHGVDDFLAFACTEELYPYVSSRGHTTLLLFLFYRMEELCYTWHFTLLLFYLIIGFSCM